MTAPTNEIEMQRENTGLVRLKEKEEKRRKITKKKKTKKWNNHPFLKNPKKYSAHMRDRSINNLVSKMII